MAEDEFREFLDARLSVKNPAWIQKARFAKWQGWRKDTPEYLRFYKETDGAFRVPRNMDLPDWFPADKALDKTFVGVTTRYKCSMVLRAYQQEFFEEYPQLVSDTDKVLNAACGTGKTAMGIYLSATYKKVTLVLVPTHFLAKQWAENIEGLTTASYHLWQSTDKALPPDRDFYIVSFDLFTLRTLPDWFVQRIGHVILDEAHRTGAASYLPILEQLPAARRTALTATFRRDDGMHQILIQHFGNVYRMKYEGPRPLVYPVETGCEVGLVTSKKGEWELLRDFMAPLCEVVETKTTVSFLENSVLFKKQKTLEAKVEKALEEIASAKQRTKLEKLLRGLDKQSYTILDNHLAERGDRNRKITTILNAALKSGRNILFLSKRKALLKRLHKQYAAYKPVLVISGSTDKMTPEEKAYMKRGCRLLFGIMQLAKEGLDKEDLDTLVLHLPIKDTEQAVGRLTRIFEGKKNPVALYLVDKNPMCQGMYRAAGRYIKINGSPQAFVRWDKIKSKL